MACPYLQETEKGFRCRLTGKKVSVMLRPCLGNYEECPIYSTYHPRMRALFKCLVNSLSFKDYETEDLISRIQSKKMPWEAERCEECACYSERYKICLFDITSHRNGRCPVKRFLEEAQRKE
ncbi:hypothetical protein IPA_03125 [Ignicoccus pacificus DSM 13166]|uniref:Uncharacterized protein n=1 Tax=Ignicoccus pacificus DSM 13166 TaxID=940294 RepID=A0A977KAW1_9CREN|nr:hypothetical protein IPA_03125 [Ignicoccus pacificus DSM 13166]